MIRRGWPRDTSACRHFPGAATTHFYQQGKLKALLNRGLGAAAALVVDALVLAGKRRLGAAGAGDDLWSEGWLIQWAQVSEPVRLPAGSETCPPRWFLLRFGFDLFDRQGPVGVFEPPQPLFQKRHLLRQPHIPPVMLASAPPR